MTAAKLKQWAFLFSLILVGAILSASINLGLDALGRGMSLYLIAVVAGVVTALVGVGASRLEQRKANSKSIVLLHAAEDSTRAREISKILEASGYRVWLEDDVEPGAHWVNELVDAIERSSATVVLVSYSAIGSAWFEEEIKVALSTRSILPVRLEDVPPTALLGALQTVDLFRDAGPERLLRAVEWHIAGRGAAQQTDED